MRPGYPPGEEVGKVEDLFLQNQLYQAGNWMVVSLSLTQDIDDPDKSIRTRIGSNNWSERPSTVKESLVFKYDNVSSLEIGSAILPLLPSLQG